MRKLMMAISTLALLAACQPASQPQSEAPPPGPEVAACNQLAPNLALAVSVQEEMAVASAASDLRGGRITPGAYDLTSARRIGAATGWNGARAVVLEVSESAETGTLFNWASTPAGGGDTDTWTASFTDTPETQMTYTCGRIGTVSAAFTAAPDGLELRLPDGANGALLLAFQRRP